MNLSYEVGGNSCSVSLYLHFEMTFDLFFQFLRTLGHQGLAGMFHKERIGS